MANQVTATMDQPIGDFRREHAPVGGNVLAHSISTRLELKLPPGGRRSGKRILGVRTSPVLGPVEGAFVVNGFGISDWVPGDA